MHPRLQDFISLIRINHNSQFVFLHFLYQFIHFVIRIMVSFKFLLLLLMLNHHYCFIANGFLYLWARMGIPQSIEDLQLSYWPNLLLEIYLYYLVFAVYLHMSIRNLQRICFYQRKHSLESRCWRQLLELRHLRRCSL